MFELFRISQGSEESMLPRHLEKMFAHVLDLISKFDLNLRVTA